MTIPLPLLAELASSAQRCSALWSMRSIARRYVLVDLSPRTFDVEAKRAGMTEACNVQSQAAREEADDARSLLFELIDRKAKALRVFSHYPEWAWHDVRYYLEQYGRTPTIGSRQVYFAADGTLMNADGTRSIFDDVDE